MLRTLKAGTFYPTLLTNVALNLDTNEPWWEGMDGSVPGNVLDWQGRRWDSSSGSKAAHPNSRFTASINQCPTVSDEVNNPKGVPISAIILGGRRTKLIPLISESFNWQNGVFYGVRMGSETTAAAIHQVGVLRRDPMAMLPFCGYNMGDYFRHWLSMGKRMKQPPRIYLVNWFRTDEEDNFIWPGFGENIRVLKWIIERVNNRVQARETPVGFVPHIKDFEIGGLDIPGNKLEKLLEVNPHEWTDEVRDIEQFLAQFGNKLPDEVRQEFNDMKRRLGIDS
jgi:phosphoenolpyruvate carboxykinase (GTP)